MKKLVVILIVIALLFLSAPTTAGITTIQSEQTLSFTEICAIVSSSVDHMAAAHRMAEAARDLGYPEEHYVIQLAKQEYNNAKATYKQYHQAYSSWIQKQIEYPIASYVWTFLKDQGYSDQVCAGIIGNMMVECGGLTLNLQWDAYSPGRAFYGLCQWSYLYFSEVQGQDYKFQCQYLVDTLENQLKYFGSNYRKGFSLEEFLALDNAYEAGYAFCVCYEVGAGATLRAKQAVVAYNYFTTYNVE